MSSAVPVEGARRIISLDAVRAAAVALMIFMDHPNINWGLPLFLRHPEWHGFRLPDLVFPAFLFVVGVSIAFSARRDVAAGRTASTSLFLRRIALLFLLGLFVNWFKYGFPLRYMGVLQRIALASAIAWPFARHKARWAVLGATLLLVAHTALLLFAAAPGIPAGSLEREANLAGWIDTALLGVEHTYRQSGFDPEGLLGVLSSAATVLLGLGFGSLLSRRKPADALPALGGLGAASVAFILGGIALSGIIPLNKPLWTSSFVLVASGVTGAVLVATYWLADYREIDWPVRWLEPMGRNALFIYIASNILPVVLRRIPMTGLDGEMIGVFPGVSYWLARVVGIAGGSLLVSAAEVTLWFLVAAWMHRRRIYIKL